MSKSVPLFKRLSTWANVISIVLSGLMANPAIVGIPAEWTPYVWAACSVLVAVCQVIKQNPNQKEWF